MAASTGDKITDTRNAARPNSARATGTRASGGVSLACDNLSGWPTASKVHFVTYQVNSSSVPVAGTQLDCYGIVSGNTIGSFTVVDGTDNGNAVGDYVEMLPTAAWGQDLSDALTSTHNRSGGLKSGLTITTPTLSVPAIADFSSATHTHLTNAQGGLLTAAAVPNLALNTQTLSNPYKFSVYRNAAFNGTNAFAKVSFDTELFDTNNNFDAVTNFRYTAPVSGFYQFNWQVGLAIAGTDNLAAIYKNGTIFAWGEEGNGSGSGGSILLQATAADYFEIFCITSGTIAAGVGSAPIKTSFSGFLVSHT